MPDLTALLNTAFVRHEAGNVAEATRLYKDIIQQFPLQPDALHMLGIIAKQQGNNDLALKLIEVALGQRTEMPLAWHNRALILRILGRKDEALQSAQQAVALDPDFAEAWDVVGFLLRDKGDFDAAKTAHANAVRLQPDHLKFLGNHALLLLATGELHEAYAIMQKVEAQDPNVMSQTMGNILKAAGYPEKAIAYYRKSREQLPDNDEVRVTEAMARLLIGDFSEGWKIWETRPNLDTRFQHIPFWDGKPIEHLLLHEDQGLGDSLQFVRYASFLKPYARKLTLQIAPVLRRLMAASFPDMNILTLEDPVPAVDARIRLLSLPAFFKYNLSSIPAPTPYLFACEEWRKPWRDRLASLPKPRIGLVWGGNPDHLNDLLRSIAFDQLEPLLKAGAQHFVSLQKGAQKNRGDIAAFGLFDAGDFLNDFADTAGLIAELDLLITVDTSVAHLAGAMGKPVWLMLPFDPDWRWMLGREDSPWYPTTRLFRQPHPRDWTSVIERVANDVQKIIAGDKIVLASKRWVGKSLCQNPQAINLTGAM